MPIEYPPELRTARMADVVAALDVAPGHAHRAAGERVEHQATRRALCVRAFRALGTSLATGQRATLSAGQDDVILYPKQNSDEREDKNRRN